MIQTAAEPPPRADLAGARPIEMAEVVARIERLRSFPLGVDDEVRVSLAGVQDKLLLTRLADGRWALPVRGAPSTHILKPEIQLLPGSARNEAFCLRLASKAGLSAAGCELLDAAGRDVLVVERFDRRLADDGVLERTHQEDACQMLGRAAKYEEAGGPSLAEVARMLRRYGGPGDLDRLLEAATLNVFVGNADAHGKNYAVLHTSEGGIRLAPAYDVMSTVAYPAVSRVAGMFVAGERHVDKVTARHLVEEAVGWGLGRHRAQSVVGRTLDGLAGALGVVADEIDPPAGLAELVATNAERLLGRSLRSTTFPDVVYETPIDEADFVTAPFRASVSDAAGRRMCVHSTAQGKPCPWHALPGKAFCGHHDGR